MTKLALEMTGAFEKMMVFHATLLALLAENNIQVSVHACDEYLKDHPEIAQEIHQKVLPIYDLIQREGSLELALKALRDMPIKGPIQ
jgi:hypothetical protein